MAVLIHHASKEELTKIKGIGDITADKILEARENQEEALTIDNICQLTKIKAETWLDMVQKKEVDFSLEPPSPDTGQNQIQLEEEVMSSLKGLKDREAQLHKIVVDLQRQFTSLQQATAQWEQQREEAAGEWQETLENYEHVIGGPSKGISVKLGAAYPKDGIYGKGTPGMSTKEPKKSRPNASKKSSEKSQIESLIERDQARRRKSLERLTGMKRRMTVNLHNMGGPEGLNALEEANRTKNMTSKGKRKKVDQVMMGKKTTKALTTRKPAVNPRAMDTTTEKNMMIPQVTVRMMRAMTGGRNQESQGSVILLLQTQNHHCHLHHLTLRMIMEGSTIATSIAGTAGAQTHQRCQYSQGMANCLGTPSYSNFKGLPNHDDGAKGRESKGCLTACQRKHLLC